MSIVKISVIVVVAISAIFSHDIFAAQKSKKNIAGAGIATNFVSECTSMSEINEDKVLKCSIDLSTDIGKKRFSQIEPHYVEKGEYEKKSEFDLRRAALYSKWQDKHVVFRAYDSDDNQSIVYDSDAEVVQFKMNNNDNDMKVHVGGTFKTLGTYRASNAFGASIIVTKTYSRQHYIYDDEFVGFMDVEFSMPTNDAKKNFKNLIVLYDAVLELRPNSNGDGNDFYDSEYSELKPEIKAPYESEFYKYYYYVKIKKIMIVNKVSGKVLAIAKSNESENSIVK